VIDVVVAGGGPAGLAAAIRCARRRLQTVLYERSPEPVDKACGEGLMPAGVRELEALGVRIEGAKFAGIRYVQEDGRRIDARFREGFGLGIRRLDLSKTLFARARECGVELRRGSIQAYTAGEDRVEVRSENEALSARLLIAADGLHSPLRKLAGLDAPNAGPQRYGVRRHFGIEPFSDFVEVHWREGCEAYLTPLGPRCLNVAFLSSRGARFEELLELFPEIRERLRNPCSDARGSGPLLQNARSRHSQRLALLGDAGGYVDAITGQGLSLAFAASELLVTRLPQSLDDDLQPALRAWDRALGVKWLRYALPARALVALSQRPNLRRKALAAADALGAFSTLVSLVG
jgi:flavin-dependent dehydrogenase